MQKGVCGEILMQEICMMVGEEMFVVRWAEKGMFVVGCEVLMLCQERTCQRSMIEEASRAHCEMWCTGSEWRALW